MKYKIVIFDLDGTILNTLEDLADSTNYALSVFDMPERTIEEIRHFVGNGIRKLMERAVPQGTPESMIVKVHETFTEHYKKHCADKTRPYDGIKELIENIRNAGVYTLRLYLTRLIMECRLYAKIIFRDYLIMRLEREKA